MSKNKKISGYIKLQIAAGQANPSPPVGPALGQRGVNIMEFCKAFNAITQKMEQGAPVPVTITVYADRSFTFKTKVSPTSYLIKKVAKIKKGGSETGKIIIGSITTTQLREIAEIKKEDLNSYDLDAAVNMIRGTAVSMGLEVVEE